MLWIQNNKAEYFENNSIISELVSRFLLNKAQFLSLLFLSSHKIRNNFSPLPTNSSLLFLWYINKLQAAIPFTQGTIISTSCAQQEARSWDIYQSNVFHSTANVFIDIDELQTKHKISLVSFSLFFLCFRRTKNRHVTNHRTYRKKKEKEWSKYNTPTTIFILKI